MRSNTKHDVLFCWSGGGPVGMDIHVGIWKALVKAGITSTANAGTSAGAIIAAFNSAGKTQADTENILRNLHDRDVLRKAWLWWLRILWLQGILRPEPIVRLLQAHLPIDFTKLEKPLDVAVTSERYSAVRFLNSGLLPWTVLASMSIAGIFPPVQGTSPRDLFSDGGTTANLPLPPGWADYDEVYLLIAKRPVDFRARDVFSRLLLNVDLLMEDQVRDTIRLAKTHHNRVRVLWPELHIQKGSMHFDHSLINAASVLAGQQLKKGTK